MLSMLKVRKLVKYDPDTGLFTWLYREGLEGSATAFNTKFAGKEAFTYITPQGYKQGAIDGTQVFAHTVAYLLLTGRWVVGVDHINGDKADNREDNLREADHALNARNMPIRSDNTSGFTGVCWSKQRSRWFARLHHEGKQVTLGFFKTKEEAIAARVQGNLNYGYHANHGRKGS
jgi:hypothetical protein